MKTASYAAQIIAEVKRETKSQSARLAMARLAIKYGRYTPEAKDLWLTYLASEEANK